jgi:hypothetical protein
MAVVLCGEPLVRRRDGVIDVPYIDDSPVGGPFENDLLRKVGERDERLPLRKSRKPPLRKT